MGKWQSVYKELKKQQNKEAGSNNKSMLGDLTGLPRGMTETAIPNVFTNAGDTSFDPRDCSNPRNSTSPFCGYNPISTKPFGIGVELAINGCGARLRVKPTFGFIDLPPADLVLMNPDCREDYDRDNGKDYEGDLPSDPNGTIVRPPDNFPPTPDQTLPALEPDVWYLVSLGKVAVGNLNRTQSEKGTGFIPYYSSITVSPLTPLGQPTGTSWLINQAQSNENHYAGGINSRTLTLARTPQEPFKVGTTETRYPGNWLLNDSRDFVIVRSDLQESYIGRDPSQTRSNAEDYKGWQNWQFSEERKYTSNSFQGEAPPWRSTKALLRAEQEASWMSRAYGLIPAINNRIYDSSTGQIGIDFSNNGGVNPDIFAGRGKDIEKYIKESRWNSSYFYPNNDFKVSYFILELVPLPSSLSSTWKNPPPDICDCMSCCNPQDDQRREQKQDKILAELEEIKKRLGTFPVTASVWDDDPKVLNAQKKDRSIKSVADGLVSTHERANHIQYIQGVEEFPITMPDSLIEPVAQNGLETIWNWFNPKKSRKILNIPQYINWVVDVFEGKFGHTMQYLEYEGEEKGKKVKKKVVLPDLMTAVRELYKQQTAQIQMQGMQTDISLKNLQQTTNNAVVIARVDKTIADIQLYLDYVTREKTLSVPVQISPTEQSKNLEQYLQPSTLQITYDEWMPDNDTSLVDDLDDIKNTLSIIRMQLGGES